MRILCDDVREAFAADNDTKLVAFVESMQQIILTLPGDWRDIDHRIFPQLRQESMEAVQRLVCEDAT